jgi:hypothetical protein
LIEKEQPGHRFPVLSNLDGEPAGRVETAAQPVIARASGDADICAGLDEHQQRAPNVPPLLLCR